MVDICIVLKSVLIRFELLQTAGCLNFGQQGSWTWFDCSVSCGQMLLSFAIWEVCSWQKWCIKIEARFGLHICFLWWFNRWMSLYWAQAGPHWLSRAFLVSLSMLLSSFLATWMLFCSQLDLKVLKKCSVLQKVESRPHYLLTKVSWSFYYQAFFGLSIFVHFCTTTFNLVDVLQWGCQQPSHWVTIRAIWRWISGENGELWGWRIGNWWGQLWGKQ